MPQQPALSVIIFINACLKGEEQGKQIAIHVPLKESILVLTAMILRLIIMKGQVTKLKAGCFHGVPKR